MEYFIAHQERSDLLTENLFAKLFEHNNCANRQIIQACSALCDAQLDAEPPSAAKASIRATLSHLVTSQQGYLSLLTLPVEARRKVLLQFSELLESATNSGEALLALVTDAPSKPMPTQLRTTDGFFVVPWIVMVQIINHATEHREQIKNMLSALGVTPPDLDGWAYGFVTNTLTPISK